jgi:hypothetical protein
MGAKKKQPSHVPAFIDPPGPLAPIEDWIEHRRELDRLEADFVSVIPIWRCRMKCSR